MPNPVVDSGSMEGAAQVALLQKRIRGLSIAFENIDAERKYLRRALAQAHEYLTQAAAVLKPYEGQDNVYVRAEILGET